MNTLHEMAESLLIQKFGEGQSLYPETLPNQWSDDQGSFRQIWKFDFHGRKYVLKVDYNENCNHYRMGCRKTMERWIKYCQSPIGHLLCPVFAHGYFRGWFWVVQPKRQTVGSIYSSYRTKSYEAMLEKLHEVREEIWEHTDIPDLHAYNFGMTNRGKWQVIDY